MTIPNITSLPEPPSTESPSTFDTLADAWTAHFYNTFDTEMNASIDAINTTATDIDNNKTAAEAAEAGAVAAETKAEEWADNPEDVEVEVGKYSAKHWAMKASKGDVFNSTSSTTNTISTGSKTFTLNETNRAYTIGTRIRIVDLNDINNTMEGVTTSYSSNTLIINVTDTTGSGSSSNWNIGVGIGGDAATLSGYSAQDIFNDTITKMKKSFVL